jgi:hypothetical protein
MPMKRLFNFLVGFLGLVHLVSAQVSVAPSRSEIANFIQSLPTTEEMDHDMKIAVSDDHSGVTDSQRKEARDRIAKARIDYDHLYRLLHKGASLNDYPGLLGLGGQLDVGSRGRCVFSLGIYPRLREPSDPAHSYIRMIVDENGVIEGVGAKLNPLANM